jgi:phosphate:Na+ symporter
MMGALENIFTAAGGLGLLLFGMKMMSTGLEVVAGDKLQSILKKATSNRFVGVIVGILATIAINSSTAVTIITVGFVNSGLMSLVQSIGVIMGVNVGTTFSAQLIAFRIDTIAPLFIFIGIIMYLFFKRRSIKNVGYVVLGFGVLLFSIRIMSSPLRQFADEPAFQSMLVTFQNPFLALLAGFVFTAIIQSSSATMGLLVTMHLTGIPIPFETSAFIILGTNIGTSITTVVASIPASRDSKRAALFHISYDIIGSLVFGSLILLFPGILQWFQNTWSETARQVAMFHTLYNVATLLLLLPFVGIIAALMQKVIPVKGNEKRQIHERRLIYLSGKVPQNPTLAVVNAELEVNRMGKIANENLIMSLEAFFEKDEEKARKMLEDEKTVNFLQQSIIQKLVEINNMHLSMADAEKIGAMFGLVSDIERIGDHAENISEYALEVIENNSAFTDSALEELKNLADITKDVVAKALHIYENQDESQLHEVDRLEDLVDDLSVEYAKNHIERLKAKNCKPRSGVIFIDMLSDLERSSDHAKNIAFASFPKG